MTGAGGPLIGILGGMGPAATSDFYATLIRLTPASSDQEHPRVVIWADPTVPPRVPAVLAGTDEPYPKLLAGARVLAGLGVTVAAMPCHTAHVYLPRLVEDSGVPFVDMVAETVRTLSDGSNSDGSNSDRSNSDRSNSDGSNTVGIMSTRGTLHSGLYQQKLAAVGLTALEPDADTQQRIDLAIEQVKAGDIGAAGAYVADATRRLQEAGVHRVVLACTELSVALRGTDTSGLPLLIDPSEVLAAAVLSQYARQRS